MNEKALSPYLRLISRIGNTRHPGGLRASDLLLKKSGIDKKWRVLDVGCGAGHSSAHVAEIYGCSVTGVDVSENALSQARALYEAKPYSANLHFERAEIFNLPFSDAYFDLVLCESVLFFVKDKYKALQEMSRVLKPGGFLLLNELCLEEGPESQSIKKYFSRHEFKGYLSKASDLLSFFAPDSWVIQINDLIDFSIKDQLRADLAQFGNRKGLLQLFELCYLALTDKQFRSDARHLTIFLLNRPPKLFSSLASLRLLAQKKSLISNQVIEFY